MVNLQIKLDGLKQNSLQCHNFFSWVTSKLTKLMIIS